MLRKFTIRVGWLVALVAIATSVRRQRAESAGHRA
jgi:hypothetical protein